MLVGLSSLANAMFARMGLFFYHPPSKRERPVDYPTPELQNGDQLPIAPRKLLKKGKGSRAAATYRAARRNYVLRELKTAWQPDGGAGRECFPVYRKK